jgi:hypothetical protein
MGKKMRKIVIAQFWCELVMMETGKVCHWRRSQNRTEIASKIREIV